MSRAILALNNPSIVSGLKAWFKADSITGLADAASVTTWADSSGNSNDVTTGNASPIYKTNQANGLPIVRFTRASTQNLINNAPSAVLVSIFNWFVVLKRNSTSNAANHSILSIGTSTGARQLRFENDRLDLVKENSLDMFQSPCTLTDTASFHLIECHYEATGNIIMRLDDQPGGRLFNGQTFIDTSAKLNIGKNTANTTEFLDADVAEIMVFAVALAETDKINIRQYLAKKYALSIPTSRLRA